jgi:hypothetical protein
MLTIDLGSYRGLLYHCFHQLLRRLTVYAEGCIGFCFFERIKVGVPVPLCVADEPGFVSEGFQHHLVIPYTNGPK